MEASQILVNSAPKGNMHHRNKGRISLVDKSITVYHTFSDIPIKKK